MRDPGGGSTTTEAGPEAPDGRPVPGRRSRRRADALVLVLLAVALVLRCWGIGDPPLGEVVPRQLFAAQQARAYAEDLGMAVPDDWYRADQAAKRPEVELPVLPAVTAVVWRVVGAEPLWVPRLLVALAWIGGGWLVHRLLRRLLPRSLAAGPAAAALWLFLPFAVGLSRVLLPDPLMVTGLAATALAAVIDDDEGTRRSHRWLLGVGAATVLVKLVAALFVVPLVAVLLVRRSGWRALATRRAAVSAAVLVGPAVAYQLWGVYVAGFLAGQEGGRILPELLTTSWFWSGWLGLLLEVLGVAALALVAGGVVLARGRCRAVLVSLLGSYVAFGLLFTYHYRTHDYYHLPAVLPVAIAVGVVVARVERALAAERPPPPRAVAAAAVVVVLAVMAVVGAPRSLVPSRTSAADVEAHVRRSERLGEAIDHSDRVVWVAPWYGQPAEFWGHLAGVPWPAANDLEYEERQGIAPLGVEARLDELTDGEGADWLVVLDPVAWADAPDLQAYVEGRFRLVADTDDWRIYDLRAAGDATG